MKYLVTGRPRTRTAWLSALFYTDRIPTFHDDLVGAMKFDDAGQSFGLFGSGPLCMDYQHTAKLFSGCPIVVIERDEAESRQALEKRYGVELTAWGNIEGAYQGFLSAAGYTLRVPVERLDEYDSVNEIYRHCTGGELSRDRFAHFHGLKIEQFSEKLFGGA